MSLIYLTHHSENVYNIADTELTAKNVKEFKVTKNKFSHSNAARKPVQWIEETETGKKIVSSSQIAGHKTMGYAETPLRPPTGFLKKQEGVKWERRNDHVCPPYERRPPVPKKSEITTPPKKNDKNFKNVNIKKAVCSAKKQSEEKYVDTRRGDTHALKPTGLVPKYVHSQKFGKVPKYLLKAPRKGDRFCADREPDPQLPDSIKLLSTEERLELLKGLKNNWYEMQKTYQGLPVFTDTQPKKMKKSKLEKELKQLEQDILLIESNPMIYVCEDDEKKVGAAHRKNKFIC